MPDRRHDVLPRCMRACGIAYLRALRMLRICRSAPNLRIAASKCSSRTIEAVVDREAAAGSGSKGDPDLTSAAHSGQPCPTDATRPGTSALGHILIICEGLVGSPFQAHVQHVKGRKSYSCSFHRCSANAPKQVLGLGLGPGQGERVSFHSPSGIRLPLLAPAQLREHRARTRSRWLAVAIPHSAVPSEAAGPGVALGRTHDDHMGHVAMGMAHGHGAGAWPWRLALP